MVSRRPENHDENQQRQDHGDNFDGQHPQQNQAAHIHLDAFGTPLPSSALNILVQRQDGGKRFAAIERRFIAVTATLIFFMTTLFMGGHLSGSLALLTGPALMCSELLGYVVSMRALTSSLRSTQAESLTFGWQRAEVVGTLLQISTVWIMLGWMVVEAYSRYQEPVFIQSDVMLIVAVMSFIFNLIQMRMLHSGSQTHYDIGEDVHHAFSTTSVHSRINHDQRAKRKIKDDEVKKSLIDNEEGHQAEAIHGTEAIENYGVEAVHDSAHDAGFRAVLANLFLSFVLIAVAALIFLFPQMAMGDLIYVAIFAPVMAYMTLPVARDAIVVMMEGAPKSVNVEQLREDIMTECGSDITDLHDLHVWTISVGNVAMTCHIQSVKPLKTLAQVTELCRRRYKLFHTAIQVEGVDDKELNPHAFKCQNDIHQ